MVRQASWLCMVLASVSLGAPPVKKKGPPPPPAPVKLCVTTAGEARYRNYGYDHLVRITSSCDVPSECAVTTNVSPGAIKVTVPAGQTVEVLTFRGSPAATFTHQAVCTPP